MRFVGTVLASAALLAPFLPASLSPAVTPGLDRLREDRGERLAGRRIGLITNHTGRAMDGTSALRLLREELGLSVVALFSPEHGFTGEIAAGDEVSSGGEPESGLPLFSLYGPTRAPTRKMLSGIDTLVFDIQDVGVRFYTYISTMKLAMEAAAAAGVEFVVLDRPNPNGGLRIEGPVLEPAFASFVGIASIPVLHGMTVGELARWFKAETPELEALELTVVPIRGWKRDMDWKDTGLDWRAPSPNIRTVQSALAYPALGLLEGVNVSEGRGTERTFELAGAPWLESEPLVEALSRRALPGVVFRSSSFVPRAIPAAPRPKYRGELCRGFVMEIRTPSSFEAVRTGLEAIAAIRKLHSDSFEWVRLKERYWIDLLLGTDRARLGIEQGLTVEALLQDESRELERFRAAREAHLLY